MPASVNMSPRMYGKRRANTSIPRRRDAFGGGGPKAWVCSQGGTECRPTNMVGLCSRTAHFRNLPPPAGGPRPVFRIILNLDRGAAGLSFPPAHEKDDDPRRPARRPAAPPGAERPAHHPAAGARLPGSAREEGSSDHLGVCNHATSQVIDSFAGANPQRRGGLGNLRQ